MDGSEIIAALSTPAAICSASALLFGGVLIDRAVIWYQERRIARACFESALARVRSRNMATTAAGVLAAPSAALTARPGAETGQTTAQAPVAARSQAQHDSWAPAEKQSGPLDLDRVHTPQSRVRFSTAAVIMSAQAQADEFVEFVRANQLGKHPESGVWECQRSHEGWVSAYQDWAQRRGIVAVHQDTFLKAFAKVPGVIKPPRKRLKDPGTGNVIKLPSGVPARATYYIVREAPVPVCEPVRRKRAA